MDCVRTAVRQGAKSVKCLYRRDKTNMPGSQREVQNAIEEGVDFQWLTLPTEYSGNGSLKNVRTVLMQLGEPDESGRRKPEPKEGTEKDLDVDLAIEALGFEPENLPKLFDHNDLTVTRGQWGTTDAQHADGSTVTPLTQGQQVQIEWFDGARATYRWYNKRNSRYTIQSYIKCIVHHRFCMGYNRWKRT